MSCWGCRSSARTPAPSSEGIIDGMRVTLDEIRARAQSLLDGDLKPSQFVASLHDDIGHSGPEDLQNLVELSDIWMLGAGEEGDLEFDSAASAESPRAYVQSAASQIVRGVRVSPFGD